MRRPVRAVIDTNVLVSAQFWHGAPHLLFNYVRSRDVLIILSPALLSEFTEVIGRSKFEAILARTDRSKERVLAELRQLAEIIDPPPLAVPVCRDPDDDHVLALASAAHANVIISGDDDLLSLGAYQSIRILRPAEALGEIQAAATGSTR
jgi:putative PIN family toxin of toxin-antitoxin system